MVIDWNGYENVKTKLPCRCEGCGGTVFKTINQLDKQKRCFCKKCCNRKTIDRDKYPMVLDWTEYENTYKSKLPCKCEGCGGTVFKTINQLDFQKKCHCKKCGRNKIRRAINRKGYPMVLDWTVYENTYKSKLPCKCQGCGGTVFKTICMLDKYKSCYCRKCAYKKPINYEDYPMVLSWDEYIDTRSKLPCKCEGCGETVLKSISKLDTYKRCFCKKCSCKRRVINKEDYLMVLDWTGYESTETKLPCECQGCGETVLKSIHILDKYKNCYCRKCGQEQTKRDINKDNYSMVTNWEGYENTMTKLPCKCEGCGETVLKSINQLDTYKTCFCKKCGIRIKAKQTYFEKYGTEHPSQSTDFKKKRKQKSADIVKKSIETKRKNGTMNTSKPEDICHKILTQLYGESNVERNWNKDSRYPFQVDFYIIPTDTFIECNFYWTHGKEPFDENNTEHVNILNEWKTKETSGYKGAIDTWTVRDPLKFKTAQENNLNYLMFYTMTDFKNRFNKD